MTASHPPLSAARCENCETVLQGRYCHVCGQHAHNPLHHFGHALEEIFESFWHLDGRIFRSLRDLFVPGRVAAAYLSGQRVRYIAPLRLFVIFSLLTFFVGKLTLHLDPDTADPGIASQAKPVIEIDNQKIGESQYATATTIEQVAKIRAQALADLEKAHQDSTARWFMAALGNVAVRKIEEGAEQRWKQLGATSEQINKLRTGPSPYPDASAAAPLPATPREQGWLKRWAGQRLSRIQENAALVERDPDVMVRLFLGALPGALLVLVPLFALFLKLSYLRSGRGYLEHLVVALYSHVFMLAALLMLFLLIGLRSVPGSPFWLLVVNILFSVAAMIYIPIYLLLMQKRIYAQGWLITSIKYLVLGTVYSVLLVLAIVYAAFAGLSS